MGEEPERLREAKSKLEYLRYGDGNFTPLDSTDAEALLAEVERLAEERDDALHGRDLARLDTERERAECERLAGRVAALTEALRDLDRWADGAEYGWYVKGVTQTALAEESQ